MSAAQLDEWLICVQAVTLFFKKKLEQSRLIWCDFSEDKHKTKT